MQDGASQQAHGLLELGKMSSNLDAVLMCTGKVTVGLAVIFRIEPPPPSFLPLVTVPSDFLVRSLASHFIFYPKRL